MSCLWLYDAIPFFTMKAKPLQSTLAAEKNLTRSSRLSEEHDQEAFTFLDEDFNEEHDPEAFTFLDEDFASIHRTTNPEAVTLLDEDVSSVQFEEAYVIVKELGRGTFADVKLCTKKVRE
jgi:hypothetical protein